MEAVAKLKNFRMSPRKVRLVADLIRGEDVGKALNTLKFTKKHAAHNLEKLLRSAISNWENKNAGKSAEDADLFIKKITVDPGRMLKRFRPAPFGRPHRIRKRSNHVTIVIDSRLAEEQLEQLVEQATVAAEVAQTDDAPETDNQSTESTETTQ